MKRTSNSQQRLLTVAGDLLWEKSYHSVTVEDICARARVMRGSFYYFFDSKNALVVGALQHFWKTVAKPAYEQHFSTANPPPVRIANFLNWLQDLQLRNFRCFGRVLGWPFFNLGCELGTQDSAISKQLGETEAAELFYFESAIRDAVAQDIIEPVDPRLEALWLRAAVEGILARARILNDPQELSPLAALPMSILRRIPRVNGILHQTLPPLPGTT